MAAGLNIERLRCVSHNSHAFKSLVTIKSARTRPLFLSADNLAGDVQMALPPEADRLAPIFDWQPRTTATRSSPWSLRSEERRGGQDLSAEDLAGRLNKQLWHHGDTTVTQVKVL